MHQACGYGVTYADPLFCMQGSSQYPPHTTYMIPQRQLSTPGTMSITPVIYLRAFVNRFYNMLVPVAAGSVDQDRTWIQLLLADSSSPLGHHCRLKGPQVTGIHVSKGDGKSACETGSRPRRGMLLTPYFNFCNVGLCLVGGSPAAGNCGSSVNVFG